jgi:hypothetical protein
MQKLSSKAIMQVFQKEVLSELMSQDMAISDLGVRVDRAASVVQRWLHAGNTPFLDRFVEMMQECGYENFSLELHLD